MTLLPAKDKIYQRYRIRNILDDEYNVLENYKNSAEYEGLEFTGVEEHWTKFGILEYANYYMEVCGTQKEIDRFERYCEETYVKKYKIKQYRTER